MSNWKLSRRHLLTTTGAALLLPFLESAMGRKAKAATPDPRRFISLYMPNGTYNKPGNQMWYPTAAGALTAASAPPALSPFASSFGDFSVMMGLTNKTRDSTSAGGTGDHLAGISTYLTGKGPTDRTASTSTVPEQFDFLEGVRPRRRQARVRDVDGLRHRSQCRNREQRGDSTTRTRSRTATARRSLRRSTR